MKQYTYKKLFKRFGVLFLVPNIYGMEYGVVKHDIYGEPSGEQFFMEVTKDALGIKNIHSPQEAIDKMQELFDAFEIRRKKDILQQIQLGGKNLAFYKGKAYINGLIPTIDIYDHLYLKTDQKSEYQVVQLYEVLGVNKEYSKKIETLARLNKCFNLLTHSIENFPIQFWNNIRGKDNSQIDAASNKYRKTYNNWNYKLQATVDYIKSLQDFGIDTRNLELSQELALNMQMLHNTYSEASQKVQNILAKYLEEFGKYIAYFNIYDSVKFLNEIYQLSKTYFLLDYWIDVIKRPEYNRYTHTEYMIRYLHQNELTPLYMISFFDVCKICEKMLAETTPEKSWRYNTFVVSAKKYANSRKRERPDDQTNFSLLLLQLHPKYFNYQFVPSKNQVHTNVKFPTLTPTASLGMLIRPSFGVAQPQTSFDISLENYNDGNEDEDMMDIDEDIMDID